MPILRILTWNVLYGGAGREELIGAVVRQLHPDIAVFTEARATPSFDAIADAVGPYRAPSGTPRDRECIVVASRWPIVRSENVGPRWAPSKWVVATAQPPLAAAVTVAGVHFTPQLLWPFELLRKYEAATLLKYLANEGRHIIAGDFNALNGGDRHKLSAAAWWVRAQWILQGGATPRWALTPLKDAGYVDCYRARNPGSDGFTVPAWDPQARIDYLFASRDVAPALVSSGIGTPAHRDSAGVNPRRSVAELLGRVPIRSLDGAASDHLPVWADFEWHR